MDNVTIISYPAPRDNSLLSLTDGRSRYMLPFGGRFRIIDFTLRNSFSAGARTTIIYSNEEDSLDEYVDRYGPFTGMKFPPVKVITREYSDINTCYHLIMDSNTRYYVIYNGDIPSIIDFKDLIKKYRSAKTKALLFKIQVADRASMAYKVLVIDQKSLLKIVNQAIHEKRTSPNIFEMVINTMVNKGVKTSTIKALYWPLKNIPEYYDLHWQIIFDPRIFNLLYEEKIIQSKINAEGFASIGSAAKVSASFISDACIINGTVTNSIIYPGVHVAEGAVVKDSIILPHVKIGPEARIYHSIFDERTDINPENAYYNIEGNCRVGNENHLIKNNDFPESLFAGITLIGKDCRIQNEARIGGGCYVASGRGGEYFAQKKFLYDGTSAVK
ncbi:MAG TPA: hypothetical protein PK926_06185 [Spirochaetota bacterium]|nr:hypothetical protein [Spirochaetota bacterium]HPI89076.1 hypothetical protein [Spirochaetota bacterium]HPR48713.1 hypothetical protein [Spirochaetota bacterium]